MLEDIMNNRKTENEYLAGDLIRLAEKHGVSTPINRLAKATITVYILHSTCWLTTWREFVIDFALEKCGFWITFLCLPIYAVLIYFLGFLLISYTKKRLNW